MACTEALWRTSSSALSRRYRVSGCAAAAAACYCDSLRKHSFFKLTAAVLSARCEQGYKLVGIRVMVPPKDLAEAHYAEHAQRCV